MSLLEALGIPLVTEGNQDGWGEVTKYLQKHYLDNPDEKKRRSKMYERLAFYRDDGQDFMEKHIDQVFSNKEIAKNLKGFLPVSGSNNVTRRIVKMVATVYQTHAKRRIRPILDEEKMAELVRTLSEPDAIDELVRLSSGGEIAIRQEKYEDLESDVKKHRKMRSAQRMAQLFNAVFLYPRLTAKKERQLRIVFPTSFSAVAHPEDPAQLEAVIIDQKAKNVEESDKQKAFYLGMDDTFFWLMNGNKAVMTNTVKAHGLGTIPGILAQNEITDDCLLDWHTGDDIIRGHKAASLLDALMMMSQKNGTKMGYLAGDTDRMGADQPMDSGSMAVFADGVSPGVLDLGDDPGGKIRAAEQVIQTLAANYNIPISVFNQTVQATSGDHLAILKSGLSESRVERIDDWRDIEQQLAELEQKVFGVKTEGFSVDFGEVAVIRGRSEELDIRKKERSMGLSNPTDEAIKDNPDFNELQAEAWVARNTAKTAQWVAPLRALNMPASPTTETPGMDAQDNGGARPQDAGPSGTREANGSQQAVENA